MNLFSDAATPGRVDDNKPSHGPLLGGRRRRAQRLLLLAVLSLPLSAWITALDHSGATENAPTTELHQFGETWIPLAQTDFT